MAYRPSILEITKVGVMVAAAASVLMHLSAAFHGGPADRFRAGAVVFAAVFYIVIIWIMFYPLWPVTRRFVPETVGDDK